VTGGMTMRWTYKREERRGDKNKGMEEHRRGKYLF
jgi:hypothetical protein